MRAVYGVDVLKNAVHGPTSKEQAEHEIKLLFGDVKFDKSGKTIFLNKIILQPKLGIKN